MKQLIHNGVLIPKYEPKRLHMFIRGMEFELTPDQEEMALAWVRKLGTVYVKDQIFVTNFFKDFRKTLNANEKLGQEDFDFSIVQSYIDHEKTLKLTLNKEEKKKLSEQHKALREANRQKYGYALVDSERTEISNYTVEPSCIFMGRGKHPLRGRWKKGPCEEDIELNISPDAEQPSGNWKAFLWLHDVMWIARWRDKLTGRMRYVWLSENSPLKQRKEIEKFDKARELQQNLAKIQTHILENLNADDTKRRKTATVCYLIDKLKIRVGDEKDPDEADTVGASTLRSEHINFDEDGYVTFSFLGKDSVPHISKVRLTEEVVRNLREFSSSAESTLFNGVDSELVSEFLGEVLSGLSAKVFRTFYASEAVESKLGSTPLRPEAPDYIKKYVATMANLKAATVCNHRRTIPKTWRLSLQNNETRLRDLIRRSEETREEARMKSKEKVEKWRIKMQKQKEGLDAMKKRLEAYKQQIAEKRQMGKPVTTLRRRVAVIRKAITHRKDRIRDISDRYKDQVSKLKERLETQRQRDGKRIEKKRFQVKMKRETRDYNLGTSLKSYIDPRIYFRWSKEVDYNWKLYYPRALQKKFSWVETSPNKST